MDELTFRPATLTDIPALIALVTSAYRGDASKQGWTTEADMLDGQRIDAEALRHDIERTDSRILLALENGEVLACAHVAIEDATGYFGMFAVSPDQQGSGVGKRLMAEAERLAREDWGLPGMRMTVIDIRDELIAFYERRGYARTGRKKPFPYGDERFGIPKRDDLRFEILEKRFEAATSARTGPSSAHWANCCPGK